MVDEYDNIDEGKSVSTIVEPTLDPILLVAENDTVHPRVLWEREYRHYTDIIIAAVYLIFYVAFLSVGLFLAAKSNHRYEYDSETNVKIVSAYFREDVSACCQGLIYESEDYDLCDQLESSGRRIRAGESYFNGDEGIFDAFLEAPEIIIGLLSLAVFVAILWLILLKSFATPIIFATEGIHIGIFIFMGVRSSVTGSRIFYLLIALSILLFDIWTRKNLLYAGRVIAYAAKALDGNPAMFLGLILLKLFYVLNAFLFVFFFSEGFNFVEVTEECRSPDMCTCVFSYPHYVSLIGLFLSLAYLWTIVLLSKIRLSIIASVVGSWHFHPEKKPPITIAVISALTTSLGTLSTASLISTIAERINRMLLEPWYKTWLGPAVFVAFPLQIFLCIFGACIYTWITMLTKFSVILHVFTGLPFIGSGKKVYKILSRHFLGGFVTEKSSKSVLSFGSYFFSINISVLAWTLFDKRFNTNTISSESVYVLVFILVGLFNIWYPVLGIFLIILANHYLNKEVGVNFQHLWVAPLAANFVGCISMMFFSYLAGIILDTIDVIFLCFAIDKDNNVDLSEELISIMMSVPAYVEVVETGEVHLQQITIEQGVPSVMLIAN